MRRKTKGQAICLSFAFSGRRDRTDDDPGRFHLPAVAVSRCQPDSVDIRAICDELARLPKAS